MNKKATVHPTADRILVKRQQRRSQSGIEVVSSNNDPSEIVLGVVAARGPGIVTITGELADMRVNDESEKLIPLKVGDGVFYEAGAAMEITIESGTFDVIRFNDVIVVLKESCGDV